MSPLPQDRYLPDVNQLATQASTGLTLSSGDLKSILSDALLSFSPLATLVGADSARALARRATNFKQSLVVSLAPIGALGMMATICKASRLEGLKEMLGAGESNINDAARELGCGTLKDAATLTMDKHGGMVTTERGEDKSQVPCAVVRLNWETGNQGLDFDALRRVVTTFIQGMMTVRLKFHLHSEKDANEAIRIIQDVYSKVSDDADFDALKALDDLEGGHGMVELHWPAPAMPLETNPLVIYVYGGFFVLGFLSIAIVATPSVLAWQSALASALLVGGQIILIFGHVWAQHIVKSQREILRTTIPRTGLGTHWMLIDKPRFTAFLARRPYSFPRFALARNHIILSQCHKFKSRYAPTWQVLGALVFLAVGFISFYIGGKSSDLRTVAVYIGLFVMANVTKGSVALLANKPYYYTHLNNFGHPDIVIRRRNMQTEKDQSREVLKEKSCQGLESATNALPSSPDDGSTEWTSAFPIGFRIHSRYLVRGRDAKEIFCFSNVDIWTTAANCIMKTRIESRPTHAAHKSNQMLQMPIFLWHTDDNGGKEEEFHSLLLMAIDKIKVEDLFYSVCMEIITALTENYDSQFLCSESPKVTDNAILAAVVYSVTRSLVSDQVHCGDGKFPIPVLGEYQLMQAVAKVREVKIQHDEDPTIVSMLNAAASSALRAAGTVRPPRVNPRVKVQERLSKAAADREERLQRAKALAAKSNVGASEDKTN